jgi:hypothetical protein
MKWPWHSASRGDIAAIVICAVICVGFLLAAVKFAGFSVNANWGFGPDWDCAKAGKGDPVCVKHSPANPADKTAPAN